MAILCWLPKLLTSYQVRPDDSKLKLPVRKCSIKRMTKILVGNMICGQLRIMYIPSNCTLSVSRLARLCSLGHLTWGSWWSRVHSVLSRVISRTLAVKNTTKVCMRTQGVFSKKVKFYLATSWKLGAISYHILSHFFRECIRTYWREDIACFTDRISNTNPSESRLPRWLEMRREEKFTE